MYYKVILNKNVIDVLDCLYYVKYQLKHKTLLYCEKQEAQGILSSNGTTAYHTSELLPFPVDLFPTVSIEPITKSEYDRLARLHLKSPEQIAEEVIQEMMERGML